MKKIISISIEEEILKKIEKERKLASRSRYIENILENLDTQKSKPKNKKRLQNNSNIKPS